MAGGLTYANTLGAIGGINQSGSGVTIPDTFLRWAQDVLFDNNGIIKRRSPFKIVKFYNTTGLDIAQPSDNTSYIVTASSGTGTVATLTIGTHNLKIGQPISVNGVTTLGASSPYNANTIITAVGATTISYLSTATGTLVNGTVICTTERIVSAISTINPAGERITGFVCQNPGGTRILFYDANRRGPYVSLLTDFINEDSIFDCKQASSTGMWLGFLDSYATGSPSNDYYQYYWLGGAGIETEYSNCTLNTYGTAGNTSTYTNTITGTFANVTPGMFVYRKIVNDYYYIGTVASWNAGQLTLEKDIIRTTVGAASSNSTTQTIKVVNVRPYVKNHARGLMTVTTGASATILSGNAGTEAEGHWKSANIDGTVANAWALYRASDGAWLGDVGSTTDNTTIVGSATYFPVVTTPTTLATPYILKADEYVARPYTQIASTKISSRSNISTNSVGVFNAAYAGLQWFGNAGNVDTRNRIVFSNYSNCEAVDLSANDADSIIIPSLSEMRGIASSSSGLVVFMADKTFIIRGNSRFNFSLEELYPEGCLSSMSIVEYGGGVFWASKTGLFFFDGSTVRNLTETNLGNYYTQSIKEFSINNDRIYGFFHKDYLFMHFSSWKSDYNPIRYEPIYANDILGNSDSEKAIKDFVIDEWDPDFTVDDFALDSNTPLYWSYKKMYAGGGDTGALITATSDVWGPSATSAPVWGTVASQLLWGPPDTTESFTMAIYLPTNAITVLSNFGFRGAIKSDTGNGLKSYIGANIRKAPYTYPRLIDVDSIFMSQNDPEYTSSVDEELIENNGIEAENYYKGPDFYIQTKHFTFGDPLLKKWFRQLFLNLYLIDGCLRLDIVDNEDQDQVDISRKRHKNWELFTSIQFTWDQLETVTLPTILSPNRPNWNNVQGLGSNWYTLTNTLFERRKKRFSWRYPSMGFRLYQINDYRPTKFNMTQAPFNIILESWDIGFKPMRQSRV